jgi:ligand-binding SRPBCC domain-containing protein
MAVHVLRRRQQLAQPLERVFEFFSAARNLERITPSWLRFEVRTPEPVPMEVGTLIDYRLHYRGVPLGWTSQIEVWEPGRQFVDRQLRGPYGLWHHRHTFFEAAAGTVIEDEVHYAAPFGVLGELAQPLLIERDLRRIFDYRQEAVRRILDEATPRKGPGACAHDGGDGGSLAGAR